MINKQFIYTGLLLIAVISSGWLVWHYYFAVPSVIPPNPNHPDSFAKNIIVTKMDNTGKISYILSSPLVLHYVTDDRTAFTTPLVWMYQTDQPPWRGSADSGSAYEGNEYIKLWGHVLLTQAAGPKNQATEIKTTAATLYPKSHTASTDQYIIATQPNAEMDSIGMKLNLVDHTLDLLSQVHGYYVQIPKK